MLLYHGNSSHNSIVWSFSCRFLCGRKGSIIGFYSSSNPQGNTYTDSYVYSRANANANTGNYPNNPSSGPSAGGFSSEGGTRTCRSSIRSSLYDCRNYSETRRSKTGNGRESSD